MESFGFLQPPQTESTGQPQAANASALPGWLQTGLGLFGGIVGTGVNAYATIQAAKNPKPLSADYEADKLAREREGYNVPRQVGVPTWLILGGVLLGVGVLVVALKD